LSRPRTWRTLHVAIPPITVLVALGLNLALVPLLKFESPFLLFTAAVLLSAWLGGARGGILATIASLIGVTLFFQIGGDFQISLPGHALRLSIFFAEGVLLSLLIGALQTTAQRARQQEAEIRAARDNLERRVAARTAELRALNAQLEAQAQTLAANEARYRTLVQHLPDVMVLLFDHDLRYLLAEGQALARHGFDAAAMVGRTLWEVVPAEHVPVLADSYRAALAGELRTQEFTRDEHTYRTRFVPVYALDGQVIAGMAVTTDTTEQTRATRQILQREAQMRHMGQMAKIGSWSIDLATMAVTWSDEVYHIHELDASLPISLERSLSLYPPDVRPTVEQLFTRAMRDGTPWDVELPRVTASGRAIWVRAQGEAETEGGKIVRLRGTFQDITERRQLEEKLRERDLIYTTLFQVLPIGVTITDAEGQIKDANPASERLLGLSQADHQQRHVDSAVWQIIQPNGEPMPADAYASVRAQREQRSIVDVEMGVATPAGDITWLNVMATPMPVAGYGVVVVYSDITQRMQMDQTLRRRLAERETMLKEIHHRVKNNLQVVVSLLRLQGRQIHDPQATDALRESLQRVEVMALVHELLYGTDNLTVIDAAAYVPRLSQQLAHIYGTRSAQIAIQASVDDISLSLDQAVPCGLIIHELLSNSFKYAFPDGQRGTIGVSLTMAQPASVTLRVWDTGVGMATPAPGHSKRSLGMQLVHDLARQLRGSISIDGSAGTAITITFPINIMRTSQRDARGIEGALP